MQLLHCRFDDVVEICCTSSIRGAWSRTTAHPSTPMVWSSARSGKRRKYCWISPT